MEKISETEWEKSKILGSTWSHPGHTHNSDDNEETKKNGNKQIYKNISNFFFGVVQNISPVQSINQFLARKMQI